VLERRARVSRLLSLAFAHVKEDRE
jgi:hypothetical protein